MLAINYFSIYILEIYYTIVWTIHNRKLNKKINNFHERELRAVYGKHYTSFSKFLNIDKSVTIHQRNFQYLVIEIYRVKKKHLASNNKWNFPIFWKSCLWTLKWCPSTKQKLTYNFLLYWLRNKTKSKSMEYDPWEYKVLWISQFFKI